MNENDIIDYVGNNKRAYRNKIFMVSRLRESKAKEL